MTVQQVVDQMTGKPAYTTVLTTLSRLWDKGAVSREAIGRAHEYSIPHGEAGAQAAMAAHRMQRLMASRADKHSVLVHFVSGLEPEDEQYLREILNEPSDPARNGRG